MIRSILDPFERQVPEEKMPLKIAAFLSLVHCLIRRSLKENSTFRGHTGESLDCTKGRLNFDDLILSSRTYSIERL